MIFSARNEDGEEAWRMVLGGRKTVTRRTRSVDPGKIRAVQAKRGGKALGHIRILSCEWDKLWRAKHLTSPEEAEAEAKREGFKTWEGLWGWIKSHVSGELYRIEFKIEGVGF